jgi:hypothetical protein
MNHTGEKLTKYGKSLLTAISRVQMLTDTTIIAVQETMAILQYISCITDYDPGSGELDFTVQTTNMSNVTDICETSVYHDTAAKVFQTHINDLIGTINRPEHVVYALAGCSAELSVLYKGLGSVPNTVISQVNKDNYLNFKDTHELLTKTKSVIARNDAILRKIVQKYTITDIQISYQDYMIKDLQTRLSSIVKVHAMLVDSLFDGLFDNTHDVITSSIDGIMLFSHSVKTIPDNSLLKLYEPMNNSVGDNDNDNNSNNDYDTNYDLDSMIISLLETNNKAHIIQLLVNTWYDVVIPGDKYMKQYTKNSTIDQFITQSGGLPGINDVTETIISTNEPFSICARLARLYNMDLTYRYDDTLDITGLYKLFENTEISGNKSDGKSSKSGKPSKRGKSNKKSVHMNKSKAMIKSTLKSEYQNFIRSNQFF